MNDRLKSFITYSAKCITGAVIVLSVSHLFPKLTYADTIWCLFSVLLVLSPDGKDSISLAFNRIKANLMGATIGFVFITLFPHHITLWIISFALLVTLAAGYLLKWETAIRPALVAVVIIIMPQNAMPSVNTPIARVISVAVGCLLGIAITYVYHFRQNQNQVEKEEEQTE